MTCCTSLEPLALPLTKKGSMEESTLLIKGGHWVWSRTARSHGWSGWAMLLLIDISDEEEAGGEGQG